MAELVTDPAVAPVLPASTFYFEADQPTSVPPSLGGTVLVPGTSNTGPDNEPRYYPTFNAFINGYNSPDGFVEGFGRGDTELHRRVRGAFLGEGLPGKSGAGGVIAYRQATAAAARATSTLQNTTPVNALTLTQKWKGTKEVRREVRAGAEVGTKELVLYDGDRLAEVYPHDETDIDGLAADVNASSALVTALALIDGVALANVAAAPLAGGDDGTVLTAAEWVAMLDDLEFEPFSVFAAAGLTDPAIVTTLQAWKDDAKVHGKMVFVVVGGAAGETFAAHKARAALLNDPDFMPFGTGSIGDTTIAADGSETIISTAEGVARVAGAIARRGEQLDMVNVRFSGWRIIDGANRSQAEIAAGAGMTLLTRDGDRQAPTKIPLGVTSYTGDTDDMPRWVYSNVKFVRTNHGLVADISEDQEHGDLLGELGVTPRAADTVLGRAATIVKRRIERQIIQPGSQVMFDPDVERSEEDDFVALAYDVVYVRGMRSIRNRIRLS